MTEELSLKCPYKVFIDFDSNTYYFQTSTGASYEMLFTDGGGIFSSTALDRYEISNIIINKTKAGTGKRDVEIAQTIEAIIDHFFQDNDRVLIYTCESKDKKHYIRNRLFNSWFLNSKLKDSVNKLDYQIKDEEKVYLTSMIYHYNNRLGSDTITHAFDEVTYVLSNSKED